MNIEIMRNTLYKAYLDDFAKYCNKMGGSTAAVMGDLLSFEVTFAFTNCTNVPFETQHAVPRTQFNLKLPTGMCLNMMSAHSVH